MSNGKNDWGVGFSAISWFSKFLTTHNNISHWERVNDINFKVNRTIQKDSLSILCCNEYVLGFTAVQRGLNEFGAVNLFFNGGGWNSYTKEAKEYCIENKIGVFIADEMPGALWKEDYWNYYKKDKDGDPIYHYKSA